MRVGSICNRDVATISKAALLLDAARLMRDRHVGDLVVVEGLDPKPVAVLTDRDIVVGIVAKDPEHISTLSVGDVLFRSVVVANRNEHVTDVLQRMQRHGVRRMPIVDEGGRLFGIVTLDDVLGVIASEMSSIASLVHAQPSHEAERRV